MGGLLPGLELLRLEPESNLLLGGVDGVGAVADVAADVLLREKLLKDCTDRSSKLKGMSRTYNGEVTTDGAGGGGKRVGGTEDDTAGLDGVTALPDHGADGAGGHVGDETREEGLAGEVGVVGLEVFLGGGDELDGRELEAAVLEALDDGADQAALEGCVRGVFVCSMCSCLCEAVRSCGGLWAEGGGRVCMYLDAVRLDGDEAGERVSQWCW